MEDKLNRLSNIKAIGWTTLTIFGLLTYLISIELIEAILFSSSPLTQVTLTQGDEMNEAISNMDNTVNIILTVLSISVGLCLLIVVSAIGLLGLKNWGLILFHSTTIIVVLGIILVLGYFSITTQFAVEQNSNEMFESPTGQYLRNAQKFVLISYGTFLLIISWIITRTNILLFNRSYRNEFG